MSGQHELRCPNCGRFVEADAKGFYDRLDRCDDTSLVRCFCAERCADEHAARRVA